MSLPLRKTFPRRPALWWELCREGKRSRLHRRVVSRCLYSGASPVLLVFAEARRPRSRGHTRWPPRSSGCLQQLHALVRALLAALRVLPRDQGARRADLGVPVVCLDVIGAELLEFVLDDDVQGLALVHVLNRVLLRVAEAGHLQALDQRLAVRLLAVQQSHRAMAICCHNLPLRVHFLDALDERLVVGEVNACAVPSGQVDRGVSTQSGPGDALELLRGLELRLGNRIRVELLRFLRVEAVGARGFVHRRLAAADRHDVNLVACVQENVVRGGQFLQPEPGLVPVQFARRGADERHLHLLLPRRAQVAHGRRAEGAPTASGEEGGRGGEP
mmetsp:Transcript_96558/g.249671  ORF Transcript_96558/g.249671 Transcript_96558/m.249671 type:complete len:331 (-) Transcript_96558:27-1019(-)